MKKANKEKENLKKNNLRYNECYEMQDTFDDLYMKSKNNYSFKKLYDIIINENNIMLAYRTIKRNSGSTTSGINNHNIKDIENMKREDFIKYIQKRLNNYVPTKIKRVYIPKPDGRKRPLGIPNIEDRIIQQCIKQVLEPICEAKFYKHSYGFRPNRSTEHAIAYLYKKIQIDKCYYVINFDIKGFFDNVNHNKLISQIWTLGIHDKKVISIIKAMLKAEIVGEGKAEKGVPQGGILSPLLANIVLNELDYRISSQWENVKTRHEYKDQRNKYKYLRKTKLKEMYIVRYADDFKIICKNKKQANKIYKGTKQWIYERLQLEINEEKSGITDIRKNATEFLGFKIGTKKKKKKYVINSNITEKASKKITKSLKKQLKTVEKEPNHYEIYKLNRMIVGVQNYYKLATNVTKNFSKINYNLSRKQNKIEKIIGSKTGYKTKEYTDRYKDYKGKDVYIAGVILYKIYGIKHKNPMLMKKNICNYTEEGRKLIHEKLGYINKEILNKLTDQPVKYQSVEFNDNRISKYTGQHGLCAITKTPLDENLETHHIIPKSKGGTDEYKNLILIHPEMHKLIHITKIETINNYLNKIEINNEIKERINKYRKKVGNIIIK